ncbi:DUF6879 family protein [Streptomyces sp. NPDC018833]|uniref:DUF6879 family protein n=1 Tax=Streptomyces sp. NPDC018833 TaxID=3365053 RepID=UPI0037B1FCD0
METGRRYASGEQTDIYVQFLRDGRVEQDLDDPWCRVRREQAAHGKWFERVRDLDEPPPRGSGTCSTTRAANAAVLLPPSDRGSPVDRHGSGTTPRASRHIRACSAIHSAGNGLSGAAKTPLQGRPERADGANRDRRPPGRPWRARRSRTDRTGCTVSRDLQPGAAMRGHPSGPSVKGE